MPESIQSDPHFSTRWHSLPDANDCSNSDERISSGAYGLCDTGEAKDWEKYGCVETSAAGAAAGRSGSWRLWSRPYNDGDYNFDYRVILPEMESEAAARGLSSYLCDTALSVASQWRLVCAGEGIDSVPAASVLYDGNVFGKAEKQRNTIWGEYDSIFSYHRLAVCKLFSWE